MRLFGVAPSISEISLIFLCLFKIVDSNNGWGWNNNGGNGHHRGGSHNHNNQWNKHGGNNHHWGNEFNSWRNQFLHNHSHDTYKHGHVENHHHLNNYEYQPQYLQSFNNYKGSGNSNNFHPKYQPLQVQKEPEPEPSPSVSFSQTPSDINCPRPVMGDQSKFELRCILPNENVDKDCFSVGRILPSGTSVILRCKHPYVNENGEIRIWVCEDGTWKGEFKSISCIQESYTFNFKNQTHPNIHNNTRNGTHHWNSGNNYQQNQYHHQNQQPQPNDQYGVGSNHQQWNQYDIDERGKPSKNHQTVSPKPSQDNIVDNLFPTLLDEERRSEESLPPAFPAWTEPNQPEFQHPWFQTFEKWRQPETTTTSTTTTSTTTTRRPVTTTTTSRPTTSPYGWIFTTTTTTTSKPKTFQPETLPAPLDWNTYLNQDGQGQNNDAATMKCPSLRKRTGVQLECLAKTPVAWDPTSFLVSQSDCKTPQVIGTEAMYTCQKYFESSAGLTLQYRKCKEDGTWTGGDNGFSCALECGKSNPVGRIPLITRGEPTYKAQWPWHAALFFRDERETPVQWEYNCGATLINRRAVLTAAHCVTEFFSTKVKALTAFRIDLGRYERTKEDEFVQTFSVDDIIPHPSYNPDSFDSDLAIIILSGEVTIGFHVRPICYPQTQNSAFEALHLSDGSIGTVVGFGKNEQGELADILQMANLKVISQRECAESFTDTNYGTTLTKSTTFCAGLKNGTNVCSGDSGGGIYFPLNTAGSSRWYLQGIVSVGIGSQDGTKRCDPERFSVFTRISPYADWIVRVLSEREAL